MDDVNPLHAIFVIGNIKMYLQFISFLHIDRTHTGSWNPLSCKTRTYLFYIVNIMGADVLATQGARASATMILTNIMTMLNRNNSVLAHYGSSLEPYMLNLLEKMSKLILIFLSFLHTEMSQVAVFHSEARWGHIHSTVNNMDADDLVMQGAWALPSIILTSFLHNILVSAPEALNGWVIVLSNWIFESWIC